MYTCLVLRRSMLWPTQLLLLDKKRSPHVINWLEHHRISKLVRLCTHMYAFVICSFTNSFYVHTYVYTVKPLLSDTQWDLRIILD